MSTKAGWKRFRSGYKVKPGVASLEALKPDNDLSAKLDVHLYLKTKQHSAYQQNYQSVGIFLRHLINCLKSNGVSSALLKKQNTPHQTIFLGGIVGGLQLTHSCQLWK
jgi:hypothetical protein